MRYYVYIMSNGRHTVLYTGVTNDLENRVFDHKVKRDKKAFTAKYNCDQLVYYEEFGDIKEAIHREKQLKKYLRKWKEELITNTNSEWKDLSEGWYDAKEFELFKKFDK
jgi:putative endonuclease